MRTSINQRQCQSALSRTFSRFLWDNKSLHTSQAAHFCSMMKRLGVFLLPPGWDASPSNKFHVTPSNIRRYPFIHLGGERHCESALPKNKTRSPRPGLEPGPLVPETSALTMRPPHLPFCGTIQLSIYIELFMWTLRELPQNKPLKCH